MLPSIRHNDGGVLCVSSAFNSKTHASRFFQNRQAKQAFLRVVLVVAESMKDTGAVIWHRQNKILSSRHSIVEKFLRLFQTHPRKSTDSIFKMGFTFAAFSYVLALILDAFLIFFSIFHVSRSNPILSEPYRTRILPVPFHYQISIWLSIEFFYFPSRWLPSMSWRLISKIRLINATHSTR